MSAHNDWRTQDLPRVLWIELTSRCPFDCVFCTRKALRGAGEHMDFELYRRLIGELDQPQIIRLNYAGESGHYPRLAEAVALAAATGAVVELVTALASLKTERLLAALEAGLTRLTVSLHTLEPALFDEIYRFGALSDLRQRLQDVLQWREQCSRPFALDLAFVAMRRNLEELPAVAAYAQALGIPVLAVHPLIGRDPLPLGKASEHGPQGQMERGFQAQLAEAVERARTLAPQVEVQLSSHELEPPAVLDECARPWPWPLPPGARVAACDQSPFETAHILADGRVVACEVTEKLTLGTLREHTLSEIWRNDAYREFRQRHASGEHPACARCIYKRAYRPGEARPSLSGAHAPPAQLLRGWHPDDGGGLRWSEASAAFWLPGRQGQRQLRLHGMLAEQQPRPDAAFEVRVNGLPIHQERCPRAGARDLLLPLPKASLGEDVLVEIHCTHASSPMRLRRGEDVRVLGFGLISAEIQPPCL